jgi:DNA-binding response OmpR family regulator
VGSTPRSGRVALGEDDPDQRDLVADVLRHQGFEVIAAADGAALLALLRRGHFDLVITDLWMPSLHGGDVVRARRNDGDLTPFIVITAAPATFTDPIATLEAVTVLRKPFTWQALVAEVARAIP